MSVRLRSLLPALVASAAMSALAPLEARAAQLPPVHHVYVIVLENQNEATTFGAASQIPYLSQTLRSQGAFIPGYFGIGHLSNPNYLAMISGQAPNALTQSDCQFFNGFLGGAAGAMGQTQGLGCVYPASVSTLPGQLTTAGLSWRSYNEDMGNDPSREAGTCGHPAVGSRDNTQSATATDAYAARHNPFVYFHSIIDDTQLCNTHVVSTTPLAQDLVSPEPPNYVFITPNLCNDAHDPTCAKGGLGGLAAADAFLRRAVPQITASREFQRDGGLLMVTFDESGTGDSSACCGEIAGPGSPQPGIMGAGGGQVGAVLLSPYIKAGTVTQAQYNHYSMLRSVEDLFSLSHLGYAGLPGQSTFGSDIFSCAPSAPPVIGSAGQLPTGSEFTAVHVVRSHGRAQLTLQSVGAADLRLVAKPKRGHRKVVRQSLTPCRAYSFSLPRGHGTLSVTARPESGGSELRSLRY